MRREWKNLLGNNAKSWWTTSRKNSKRSTLKVRIQWMNTCKRLSTSRKLMTKNLTNRRVILWTRLPIQWYKKNTNIWSSCTILPHKMKKQQPLKEVARWESASSSSQSNLMIWESIFTRIVTESCWNVVCVKRDSSDPWQSIMTAEELSWNVSKKQRRR